MKDKDKIRARQIILDVAKANKERWDLTVKTFFEDLKMDRFAVSVGEEYKREWDPEKYVFYRTTEYSTPRVTQLDTNPDTILRLTKIIEHNAIYRLIRTLLKISYLNSDGTLIYEFLKEKLIKGSLHKFIDRISNSTIKASEQKRRTIANKLQKMEEGLKELFNAFIAKKHAAEHTIIEGKSTIKDMLFVLRRSLLDDDNNTPPRISDRNSLLRIMSYVIDDDRDILSFADLNPNSYLPEDFNNIKRILEVAREISKYNQEQEAEIRRYKKMFIRNLLSNQLNIKLISQGILIFKDLQIKNSFLDDTTCKSNPTVEKFELKLHLANGEIVSFKTPIINLKKLGLYSIGSAFKEYSSCLEFKSIDIGIGGIEDNSIYNFFNFITTGQINNIKLKDFLDLKELFDYFSVEHAFQEEIYNNYLLKFIQDNESTHIVESLCIIKQKPSLLFSRYRYHPYDKPNDYDNVTKEAVIETYAVCQRLASFARNQCNI